MRLIKKSIAKYEFMYYNINNTKLQEPDVMKYKIDHDYHIHSLLSSCSSDPDETPERILRYGEELGFTDLCLTDHLWDSLIPCQDGWYEPQNVEHVMHSLPLPQGKNTRFHFGCETEMGTGGIIALHKDNFDKFDFIIVPTTHLHFGFDISKNADARERAEAYVNRFEALLNYDLPFRKVGIAHLACELLLSGRRAEVLDLVDKNRLAEAFKAAANKGMGIELNACDFNFKNENEVQRQTVIGIFRLAKEQGCKFYLGSDAHHPKDLTVAYERFSFAIDALDLTEDDKFRPFE